MKRTISFSPPDISGFEIAEVKAAMESGWITTGPRTKLLEKRLAGFIETGKTDIDCTKEENASAESGEGSGNAEDEESDDSENEENASGEQNNENKMLPVHEDPLTLLRHKILFLYREKRYNEENQIGAQW